MSQRNTGTKRRRVLETKGEFFDPDAGTFVSKKRPIHAKKMSHCEKCPLFSQKVRGYFVPPEGDHRKAKLMIIGEAPGRTEAEELRPFVGDSGKVLRDLIKKAGLSEDEIVITNAVKCWPGPGNKLPAGAVVPCRAKYLDKELAAFQGTKIVLTGAVPTQSLHHKKRKLFELLGHPQIDLVQGKQVLTTWHPAYYLRTGLRQVKIDILRALKWGARDGGK